MALALKGMAVKPTIDLRHDFDENVKAEHDMKVDWDFAAESYLDQLPSQDRARVVHAVEKLPTNWASLSAAHLRKVKGPQNDLFALRVGSDLRVLLQLRNDVITIVDVVRRGQVEGLRRLNGLRLAAAG